MLVRKAFAGALTVALTGAALAGATGTAHAVYTADPDDTTFTPVSSDLIGVGSDTSQNALFRLANAYNGTNPAPAVKIATYAATGGGTLTLPGGTEITRPNGSGSGKNQLYNPSVPEIDFARSSSSLNTAETNAGLQQIPFALDRLKLAVSNDVASNAPATITPAQMVQIYSGQVTNWNQIGGQNGTIEPKIPQNGSGTRSFFIAQLTAANGGTPVTLAASVQEVQEHDPAPIRNNANAVAPFSVGRASLAGTALALRDGFTANRALYNVVRGTVVGNSDIQAVFGSAGFVCSDAAFPLIAAAGFEQLARPEDGGVCGVATQTATSDFDLNVPVEPIETTTTVTGASTARGQVRLSAAVARTGAGTAPQGSVTFVDTATETELGEAALIGGTAQITLTGRTPGALGVTATYTPEADTAFVASSDDATVVVKDGSRLAETFPAASKKGAANVKGAIVAKYLALAGAPTGRITLTEGSKVVGSGTLSGGKLTVTLTKAKLGKGKSTVKATYAGDAKAVGSTLTFTVTFK
ncbi:substrate-binding domain-containing protein [Nocardioides sp.]|uniref:substrate-binding domain-containing protein n=1 Tax=Nocardioides sp. TaxID=35761 RepID=UPI003518DDDD